VVSAGRPAPAVWADARLPGPHLIHLCIMIARCSLQAGQQQQYGLMQDCQAHMAVVEAQAGAVFHSCFQLLSRVSEVDSMVRVLHLVTVMLEALGPKAQPHFAAITAALPQVSFVVGVCVAAAAAAAAAAAVLLLCCHFCDSSTGLSVSRAQPKVKWSIYSATCWSNCST